MDWAEEMYSIVNPGEGVNSNPTNYGEILTSLGPGFGVPGVLFDLATGDLHQLPGKPQGDS